MGTKMKTLLLALCLAVSAVLLPFGAQAAGSADAPVITLSELAARPGDDITVSVDLACNPGLMGMVFKIRYDHDRLALTGVERVGMTLAGRFDQLGDVVLWLGDNDSKYDGTILKLKFHVSETAEAGNALVTLQYNEGDLSNYREQPVFAEIEEGIVHISAQEQEIPSVRITELGEGRVTYSLTASENAALIVCCYEENGRFITVIMPPMDDTVAELAEGTEQVKLLLVDPVSWLPLCRAAKK